MNWQRTLGTICVAAVMTSAAGRIEAQSAGEKAKAATDEAAAAVKASPELVNSLSKEIGATPEQAAGAADPIEMIEADAREFGECDGEKRKVNPRNPIPEGKETETCGGGTAQQQRDPHTRPGSNAETRIR